MKRFYDMKISEKIAAGFILAVLAAALIAVGIYNVMGSYPAYAKVLIIMAVEILLAVTVSTAISKVFIGQIKKVTETLQKLADSETNIEIKADSNDEIGQLTNALGKIAEEIERFKGIIDAVPFPIHVTDSNMNWIYMNKAFEKLIVDGGVTKDRKSAYGKPCNNAGANICNTQNCGIKQLLKGKAESYFDWCGMNCKQDTSYLKNRKGEVIGFVEVVTDLTSILRVNDYTKIEVDRLAKNLNMLAKGELNIDIEVAQADEFTKDARDNFIKINRNLEKTKDAIGRLITDVFMLSDSAIAGNLDVRADASKHEGEYGRIVEGINHTLNTVNDRNAWYESIIDAVPFPIHVTDNDMKWTYMNKAFETLIIDGGVTKDRKSAYGKHCSNAGANICNTQKCGIKQLLKGNGESYFDWCGMNCKQDTSYLKNNKGENIGFVEVVTDLTSILRVNEYTKKEVDRLAENLELLAKGNLDMNLSVGEADRFTEDAKNNFVKINSNLEKAKNAVERLIVDITGLSNSAIEGELSTRMERSRHDGQFKKIIEGINNTLDAIIEPIKESSDVLQEVSKGNLEVSVKGNYKGDHAKIKNALNETTDILSSYVSEISNTLTEMANGNMVVGIDREYKGDFEQIKNSINYIIQSFNDVLNDINNASLQVAAGSKQVSDSAQILSQGSAEQASAVEELTASLEQISVQTRENAKNANQANEMALTAKENAVHGNNSMKTMLNAMNGINDASSNISKIIKVIDEIAFQTNILALNAAVEAARAGQHGKGFAVVAEEVRNLAARSANAAKETTVLIEGSIKKAEDGTKIASETAEALNKIVDVVTKAADIVGTIAVASDEQASGIAQINQGIMQVSQVVQTNSATSEESASASEELSSQAEMLKEMVNKFKLKKSSAGYKDLEINPEVLKLLSDMNNMRPEDLKKAASKNDIRLGKY